MRKEEQQQHPALGWQEMLGEMCEALMKGSLFVLVLSIDVKHAQLSPERYGDLLIRAPQ